MVWHLGLKRVVGGEGWLSPAVQICSMACVGMMHAAKKEVEHSLFLLAFLESSGSVMESSPTTAPYFLHSNLFSPFCPYLPLIICQPSIAPPTFVPGVLRRAS